MNRFQSLASVIHQCHTIVAHAYRPQTHAGTSSALLFDSISSRNAGGPTLIPQNPFQPPSPSCISYEPNKLLKVQLGNEDDGQEDVRCWWSHSLSGRNWLYLSPAQLHIFRG